MKFDIEKVAEAIDIPVEDWPGSCFGIASAMVNEGVVEGTAVYGHWLGDIAPDTHFAMRAHLPFCSHGWVLLPDKTVVDPTRWVFEGAEPYIFVGERGEEYDEGGDSWRSVMQRPPPARDDSHAWNKREEEISFDEDTYRFVKDLLLDPSNIETFTLGQIHWLSNLPYQVLGDHAVQVFEAIAKAGFSVHIPMDNRLRAERKAGRDFE